MPGYIISIAGITYYIYVDCVTVKSHCNLRCNFRPKIYCFIGCIVICIKILPPVRKLCIYIPKSPPKGFALPVTATVSVPLPEDPPDAPPLPPALIFSLSSPELSATPVSSKKTWSPSKYLWKFWRLKS